MKKPWSLNDLKRKRQQQSEQQDDCPNIFDLIGECAGEIHPYTVVHGEGRTFYDEETKEPFEKSGFSIRGGFEVRSATDPRQAIITYLCDEHHRAMATAHPELILGRCADPMPEETQ